MKLTTCLMIFACLQVGAKGVAQKVSLNENKTSLEKVLKKIGHQTGYTFLYESKVLEKASPVTLKVDGVSLDEALHLCFSGQPLTYKIFERTVVIKEKVIQYALSKEKIEEELIITSLANIVTGKVTNSKGEPLLGVSVIVKGNNSGTSTDGSGNYSIDVLANGTLVFSYVGYATREIAVNGRSLVNIVLEESVSAMDQVVVVGYGTKRRGELTGSVSSIKGEELTETPTNNQLRAMQGRMPGVNINDRGGQPGDDNMEILIRGKSTLGDNSPLIIIDGIPAQRSELVNLSSYNIENISVLKDASAAVYGSRSANGVILVQTKRGKNGKPSVNMSATTGISRFTRIPKNVNSYQQAEYQNEMLDHYGRALMWNDDDLQKFRDGSSPITHPNTDWFKDILRNNAPQSHINISSQGGTGAINYFVSGDYYHEGSMYRKADMLADRYQIRSNVDIQVIRDLKLGIDISGRNEKINQPIFSGSDIFGLIQHELPTVTAWYPNGLPGYGSFGINEAIAVTNKAGWTRKDPKVLTTNLSLDIDLHSLLKGLSLKGIASYNFDMQDEEVFNDKYKLYKYDVNTDEYVGDYFFGSVRQLNQSSSVRKQKYYNVSLHYKNSFNKNHINAFVAYEQNQVKGSLLTGYRRDLLSNQLVYLDFGSTDQQASGGSGEVEGLLSYFGSISYNYDNKYLVDFTLRNDGSYKFPMKGRFGTFPSVAAGWRLSEEPFMSTTDNWLDDLKLRISWGLEGNDLIPDFQYVSQYGVGINNHFYIFGEDPNHFNGIYQVNSPNPNITWETAKVFNVGFDAITLGNNLNITFDYFRENRSDILIQRGESVPDFTGLSLPTENFGKVFNSGIELAINHNKKIGNMTYSIGGNFSFNRSKVVFMDEAPNIPSYQRKTGHPIDSYLIYETDGIFSDQQEVDNTVAKLAGTKPGDFKFKDINGDQQITPADQVRIFSSPTPRIQYGISAGVGYKGLLLDIFFQGQAQVQNYTIPNRGSDSWIPEYVYTKRWTEDNKQASFPRAFEWNDTYIQNHKSDFWLFNEDFIRLKNVSLSYKFPEKLWTNSPIGSLIVFVRGNNLWTHAAMDKRMGGKYYDPEMSRQYSDYYPPLKSFIGGISIKF